MDGGALSLLKFLFPQVPSLANTALWHTLGHSQTSAKWDLRTELTVSVLRRMMQGGSTPKMSVGKVQATTLKDPGVKGKTWVARATIAASKEEEGGGEGIGDVVCRAVEDMKVPDSPPLEYMRPRLEDIEVEWTGYRPDAAKTDAMPDIPEAERYARLMAEPTRTSETTILYFHGGAYYLCDPATHRAVTSRLAKESNGRVCSVRYRLAPQTAFPGQLMDALLVYLSLLYPPPGSLHTPVPANHIVLAGDSAGGNLAFALLQLLLHLSHTTPKLRFHGNLVDTPLPAGCSANSGWFDITRSLPSITTNATYDYLPPVSPSAAPPPFPPDDIWPTTPPRGDLFCDLSLLDHPLASVLAAHSWAGAPPMWFSTGEEMLADEDLILAATAASQGVKVLLEVYEAMPHCFAMLLPNLPAAGMCMRSWGEFCRKCVEEPQGLVTGGGFTFAKGGKRETLAIEEAAGKVGLSVEEARALMAKARERRVKGFAGHGDVKAAL